ncbi:MAG: DUF2279 domain-containing protein [Flavobacteriaceae bacterium]|nr:DUF2279 domain-containing protein [Flavobacteriaceae bacterium]
MKTYLAYSFLLCFSTLQIGAQSQFNKFLNPSDTLNIKRRNGVIITEATAAGFALIGLNTLWYDDYDRSKFHVYNDIDEWLQMDKIGHAFTTYNMGRLGADALNWSGVSKKNQLIYGGTLGFTFMTAVEIFDGLSKEWGFSWSDMAANAAGTGLYIGQELLWEEQRFMLKYSFHTTKYAEQRPSVLGESLIEQVLKDYNGQTYWLSMNLHAFFKESKIPSWLNVAFGYGADGMLTATGAPVDNMFTNQSQIRQYYFSFDVDLTRIETKSSVLKTLFSVFNVIKIPLPTIEFNSNKQVVFHLFYF